MTGSPGVFTLRLLTLSLQQFFSYGSGFFPKHRFPWSFHSEEASTSSVHLWASPVSGVAVCLLWQMQEQVSLSSIFFFFLIYTHLSYLMQYHGIFLSFFFFFSQVCRRLTPWFWLSFSSKKPSWPSNLKQGLPAISSHYHFLFFRFLIKPNVILFIHLLFNHLSPTTSMWTPWEDKPYISCSPLIPSALKDRCMVDVKKHLFKNNS